MAEGGDSVDYEKIAEPFRFNFEIAWEVANKGKAAAEPCLGVVWYGGQYFFVIVYLFMVFGTWCDYSLN